MNRRDFLRRAATAGVGAAGTIVIANTKAEDLVETGKTILSLDDVKAEGKIITREDLVDEIIDISRFGDNLADILINSGGNVTFYPDPQLSGPDRVVWRVFGDAIATNKFKQDGKHILVQGNRNNRLNIRGR